MTSRSAFPILAGFFFFLRGFDTLLILVFSSLFLESFGPVGWPWYFVGFSLLFASTQLLLLQRPHWSGAVFLKAILPLVSVAALAMAVLFPSPAGPMTFVALIIFRSWDLHATQAFYDLVGKTWPLTEARLHLPSLLAAGTLGSVLAGFFLRFLLPVTGFFPLLALAPFAGLAAWFLLRNGLPASLNPGEKAETATPDIGHSPSGNLLWSRIPPVHRRYAFSVFALSIMGSLAVNLVDFQFNGNLPAFYPETPDRPARIAALLGSLNAAMELITLLIQGLAGRWFFTHLSLRTIISIRPLVLGLCGVLVWSLPLFWPVIGLQFLSRTSTFIFMSPLWVLLLEPLPFQTRLYVRRLLNLIDCLTVTILGLSLALWTRSGVGAEPGVFLLITGIALSTLLLNRFLLHLYPEMIRETLTDLSHEISTDDLEGIRLLPSLERQALLQRLFQESSRETLLKTLLRLGPLNLGELRELIWQRLPEETDPALLAGMARILLCSPDQVPKLSAFLSACTDPRRLAEIMDAADHSSHPDFEWMFVSYFDHPHHRVRGSAVLSFLHHGTGRRQIPQALEALALLQKSHHPRDRATAAVVMGRLGLPVFVPPLFSLADDSSEEVARCAYHALASIGTPAVLEFVGQRMVDPQARGPLARQCWEELGSRDQESLIRALAAMSAEDRHRTGIWARALRSRLKPAFLQRLLRLKPPELLPPLFETLAESNLDLADLLGPCLIDNPDGSVQCQTGPILDRLRQSPLREPVAYLSLLLVLTRPEEPAVQGWLQVTLSGFVWDFSRLLAASVRRTIPPQHLTTWKQRLATRWTNFLPLLALAAPREAGLPDSLCRLLSPDPYVAALALELMQNRLPPAMLARLSALTMVGRDPEGVFRAATEAGFLDARELPDSELFLEKDS